MNTHDPWSYQRNQARAEGLGIKKWVIGAAVIRQDRNEEGGPVAHVQRSVKVEPPGEIVVGPEEPGVPDQIRIAQGDDSVAVVPVVAGGGDERHAEGPPRRETSSLFPILFVGSIA